MVKCTTLTTSAGNLIGDNPHSITAGAHGGSTLLEKVMKTIGKIATASAVAFSALAFTATPGSADSGGTSHHTAWPLLRVVYSSRHRLQFHKLCGVRGDG